MKYYLEYFHCWFHAAIHAVEAHLAQQRGDTIFQVEQESLRREWERRIHRLEINRRFA